jgi:hypothetical protein
MLWMDMRRGQAKSMPMVERRDRRIAEQIRLNDRVHPSICPVPGRQRSPSLNTLVDLMLRRLSERSRPEAAEALRGLMDAIVPTPEQAGDGSDDHVCILNNIYSSQAPDLARRCALETEVVSTCRTDHEASITCCR